MKFEDYFIEGTNVLKNKLGITDLDLLINVEGSIVLEKLTTKNPHGEKYKRVSVSSMM